MDKTPPRAGHPLDGAATRKVTGMPTGIPPEAARRALATRVLKRGAVSIPAYRWELSYWRWGRQHRVIGGIPILRNSVELGVERSLSRRNSSERSAAKLSAPCFGTPDTRTAPLRGAAQEISTLKQLKGKIVVG